MPHPDAASCASQGIRVLMAKDVDDFVRRELLSSARTLPIVALTTWSGQSQPPIAPDWLASQLGARASVVVIPTGAATYRLKELLPPLMDVYGGAARIWWPGCSPDHSPYDHPLLFIISEADVPRVASRILHFLGADAPASVPAGPSSAGLATPKQAEARIGELEKECRALAAEREELIKAVDQLKENLSEARQAAQALRKKLRAADLKGDDVADDPASSPALFLASVHEAYARLYAPADATRFPLKMIRIGPRFLESVRTLQTVGVARIIDVGAHVAAGRAHEIPGLRAHPLHSGAGGASQRVRSSDGARAWRCALKVEAPSAGRLHWWVLQGVDGGAIEFASVGVHDDVDIPD